MRAKRENKCLCPGVMFAEGSSSKPPVIPCTDCIDRGYKHCPHGVAHIRTDENGCDGSFCLGACAKVYRGE